MSEDHLREQNSLLQRKIACQRHELARLYADNSAISSIMTRLFKENWDMKKKIEAAPQSVIDVGTVSTTK